MTNLPIELARHYREEADRVRKLAADAMLPGVRDALLSVVRQYDDLAESVGNSGDYSLSVIRAQIQFGAIQPDGRVLPRAPGIVGGSGTK